jgi:raffinose/stachyose/melibiose transport system substrate-binding protein
MGPIGRLRAFLVVLGLVVAAMSGGGASASAASSEADVQGGPLTVWLGGILAGSTPGSGLRNWYDEMVKQFEAKYPGTVVDTVLMDPDGTKQLAAFRAAFGAGQGPDVAMMYPGGFTWTFAPSLHNLREIAPDVLSQYAEERLATGCVNYICAGNQPVYLAPADFNGSVLAYNKEIFADVGIQVPFASWDDLVAAGQKLKAAGYVPFELGNQEGYQSDFWLAAMYTSYLVPADLEAMQRGELKLTDPRFVEPLELWAQLFTDGLVNDDACSLPETAGQQEFLAGRAAMVSTYAIGSFWEAMGDNVGATYWPPINDSPTAGATLQVGEGWVATTLTENIPLSAAFLALVTSAEAQSAWFQDTGIAPANAAADTSIAPDPFTAATVELWKDFKLLSVDGVLPPQTQTEYFKQTALAFCGQKTAEAAMQAIQDVYEQEVPR